jgi:hypothetical protein
MALRSFRKILLLSVPAAAVTLVLSAVLIELWVRMRWDERRGTPGFYVSDPVLGQRLNAGYDGWFAGVPVKINSLGFRDDRDYTLDKPPRTFRIIVLGDSVTFGHGALYSTTYPYLVEQRLKAWRPDLRWEVWNLGVPGYNTRDELVHLKEVGRRYDPDLVIVGFYPNDLTDGLTNDSPGLSRRAVSAVQRVMQRNLYSFEFYKTALLTARWRLFTNEADRLRLEHLAGADELLTPDAGAQTRPELQLSEAEYFDDRAVRDFACPKFKPVDSGGGLRAQIRERGPGVDAWIASVRELQQLHRQGTHRIMFFINMAPVMCDTEDRFHDAGSLEDDAVLRGVLGEGTAVASSTAAFLHYRPSQMPVAGGHSIGNSNRVKADALFESLRTSVLPPLLPPER